MANHDPCAFCLKLPTTTSARAGMVSHCPLCKGQLVEFGTGPYRLVEVSDGTWASPRLLYATMAGAGLLLAGVVVLIMLNRPTPPERPIAKSDVPAAPPRKVDAPEAPAPRPCRRPTEPPFGKPPRLAEQTCPIDRSTAGVAT